MTNQELLDKIKQDLQPFEDYCIGLHNICMYKYKSLVSEQSSYGIRINKENITEEDIARKILETGLKVVKTHIGLNSTVMSFKDQIQASTFDYIYNGNPLVNNQSTCNIIVARPTYILYQGQKYLLGNLNEAQNVGNAILFNRTLHPDFIYGFYTKEITEEESQFIYSHNIKFSNTLILQQNPTFWSFLSQEEQENILRGIFHANKRALSAIKLANNEDFLKLLFKRPSERSTILETRAQIKRLELKRK